MSSKPLVPRLGASGGDDGESEKSRCMAVLSALQRLIRDIDLLYIDLICSVGSVDKDGAFGVSNYFIRGASDQDLFY